MGSKWKNGFKLLGSNRGLTLVEILIVVTILAGLAAFLFNTILGGRDRANVRQAQIQIADLGKYLETYNLDCNAYPTTEQGLETLGRAEGGDACAQGPYMKWPTGGYKDPWGNPFEYTSDGSTYTIVSYGSDKKAGGTGFAKDLSSED